MPDHSTIGLGASLTGFGQPRILLFRQAQIHPTAPHVDAVGNGVPALRVDEPAATFYQLNDLFSEAKVSVRGSEV